jgi:hypothetical protein
MADINLITAPDRLYNYAKSFLLIYPGVVVKEQFNNLLAHFDLPYNVYLYEHAGDSHEIDWLLSTQKLVDFTILDIDNCPGEIKNLVSYFIADPKTYWLTNGEQMFYNKISNKRIYNLDHLADKIGDKEFETQP